MKRSSFLPLPLAALAGPCVERAAAAADPAVPPEWMLCAQATSVVSGVWHVPADAGRASGRGAYADATIAVGSTFKGTPASSVTVRFLTDDAPYYPRAADLVALDGAGVVAFLEAEIEPDDARLARSYLAGTSGRPLRRIDDAPLAAIRGEIARQARLTRGWRRHPEWPHARAVADLIGSTLHADTQQRAFAALQKLGTEAVPAIADAMDDRRSLGVPQIELENSGPGAFEATRHYGPRLVVDALAAILNQITGANFGFIYNGAPEWARRHAVDGWHVYAELQRRLGRRPPYDDA